MKKLLIFIVFASVMGSPNAFAQNQCGSSFNPQVIQSSDPVRYNRYIQLEQHIANYIATRNSGNPNARLINPNSTITIPVVVHVLHNGQPIGVGNNISVPQIQSQIDVLNEDFRRLNADRINTPAAFLADAADPNVEFRLACIDPNGNLTDGIHRVQTTVNAFTFQTNTNGSVNEQATGIKFTAQGGTDAWPTVRYLNMWVCNIAPAANGQLLGYAQFPFDYTASPNTDGVVMLNTAFGRVGNLRFNFDLGRTTTHEVGHWLNLFHIWGDDVNACSGTDQCDDTPNQGGANQSNCPGFPNISCGNAPNGDMFMNYMDYTVDGCKNIYTQGQTNRMRAVFANGGPRAAFIDNYLRVNQPTTPICNTVNITATNPNCLPITWTVVSGPATIIGGQGTNAVTLQRTGNGIAVLRATAGGYLDDEDITMGLGTNSINFTQKEITCVNSKPYFYGSVSSVPFAGNNYNWYSKDESNPSNPFILRQSGEGNTADFPLGNNKGNRYYTIRVIVTNPCGTLQSIDAEGYLYAPSCISGLRVMTSPNPTSNTVTVRAVDESGKTSTNPTEKIYELQLVDKQGNLKQKQKYNNGTNQATINLVNLQADVYFLRIWDGKVWTTTSLIKK